MNANLFEVATRERIRFDSGKGLLSTEDLWELSLASLDTIAKSVNKKLKDEQEESFIGASSKSKTDLTTKLEILKYVIGVKLEEKEKASKRAENRAKLAELQEIASRKSTDELSGKSLEEITKMINDLKEQI